MPCRRWPARITPTHLFRHKMTAPAAPASIISLLRSGEDDVIVETVTALAAENVKLRRRLAGLEGSLSKPETAAAAPALPWGVCLWKC